MSEENDRHRYVYIGGDMICSVLTNDKVYKYISNTGNNLKPHSIAIGKEDIYLLTPHFEFSRREKIDDDNLLETSLDNVDPFNYHYPSKCGKHSFKKLRKYKIRLNYE